LDTAVEKKKLYIKTYGCQMNFYDSGKMGDVLLPLGYEPSDAVEGADMVILNTCHIREKAAEKMYSELGRIRKEKEKLKADGKQMIIAVAGCVGQAEGKEIMSRAPYVDIVVGPQAFQRLPQLVKNLRDQSGDRIDLEFSTEDKFDFLAEEITTPVAASAFLTVQEGCDKFCTFCVVPYTRGAEQSRSVAAVYREAISLVERGAREIVLLGQNVNGYHGEDADGASWNLGQLITHLAKINGLERIRYTTSHPRDMHDALYRAHAEEEKLMPFLHLPVQSGSTSTLKAMNRQHTREDYLMIIEKLRRARPDIALSSDFIVGFPGETDADFKDTMKLIAEVGFASSYSFKYSPRPGTPAAVREDQVPEAVKDERLQELQALVKKQQDAFNEAAVDTVVQVLLDREGRHEGQLQGRTPYMHAVHLQAPAELAGSTVPVRVMKVQGNSLSGGLADNYQGKSDVKKVANQ
jgi:tRNA-2-methylthio-N6-dimethylallyladenosine synthase